MRRTHRRDQTVRKNKPEKASTAQSHPAAVPSLHVTWVFLRNCSLISSVCCPADRAPASAVPPEPLVLPVLLEPSLPPAPAVTFVLPVAPTPSLPAAPPLPLPELPPPLALPVAPAVPLVFPVVPAPADPLVPPLPRALPLPPVLPTVRSTTGADWATSSAEVPPVLFEDLPLTLAFGF